MHFLRVFTWQDLLAQLCGLFGCILFMIAYQAKDPRRTQLIFAPGNFFYGMQACLLLGHLSGSGIIIFVSMARDIASAYCSDKFLRRMAVVYIPCVWLVGFLFNRNWQEYAMCVTATVSTLAIALRGNFMHYRGLLFVRQFFSLAFAAWIASIPSTVYSLFMILSNVIGTARHLPVKPLPEPLD